VLQIATDSCVRDRSNYQLIANGHRQLRALA